MDEPVTFQSVQENFTLLSSGNDLVSFNQAKTWRKGVISNKDNIFLLIKFFQEYQIQPECQIFIIKMIRDMIDSYLHSLPLSQIGLMLSQTNPEILNNPSVTLILGNLIGYIARFVYQNEHSFIFEIGEDQKTCTKLQWAIYHDIVEYMDQPKTECNEEQNNDIIAHFKSEVLASFFFLSLRAIEIETETKDAIHLLVRCVRFGSSKTKPNFLQLDDAKKEILDILQNEALFDKFIQFALNSNSPLSSDTVDLMSTILNSMTRFSVHSYLSLIDMIINFCSEILESKNFFKDQSNVNSFKNVFSSFPKTMEVLLKCQQLCLDFLSFIDINLYQNYCLSIDILFSVSSFFESLLPYISKESQLYKNFTNFFNTFIQATLKSLENDPIDTYNSILLDSAMRGELKKLIKNLFNLSGSNKNDCALYICELFNELIESPFNNIINLQLGFLLFVARIAMKNLKCESNFFESIFKLFLSNNDKINEFIQELDENEPFVTELYSLSFLKSFLKLFFSHNRNCCPEISLFDSPESVVVFIFQRFWNDMINNVCPEKSNSCLRNFIRIGRQKNESEELELENEIENENESNEKSILDIISVTDYPSNFLDNYLILPPKSIVYKTVVNVMLSSDEIRPRFLQSLEENFVGKEDDESLNKLFKIFSSWFDCYRDSNSWKTTYLYFITNFTPSCFKASISSPIFISLLKLLYKIIVNLPSSNPFDSNEPYSFEMMNKMMTLLTNITNETTNFLKPIQIDEEIYDTVFVPDTFDSKPISLSEAHKIGLNERQMKMKMSYSSKAENINEDDAWSNITVIIFIAKSLMKSSISNFGIMELYDDKCIFVFFDSLITALSHTTPISIVSQGEKYDIMIQELSELNQVMVDNFRNIVIGNEKFYLFILEFIRITFLSHNSAVITHNCTTLSCFIRGFSKPSEIEILRNHFVLAFNAALYFIDCFSARNFVFEFARIDSQFFAQIGSLIENDLTQEVCKNAFHESFDNLWKGIENVKDDNEEVKKCFKHFLDSITPHSIKLYSLPSLSQYFNFRS